jgi:hypothetical protein
MVRASSIAPEPIASERWMMSAAAKHTPADLPVQQPTSDVLS